MFEPWKQAFPPQIIQVLLKHRGMPTAGIHLNRDSQWSIAYSAELISSTISATLQNTDRHDGIVGQERWHFQRDL
jgi:hypothetical protein